MNVRTLSLLSMLIASQWVRAAPVLCGSANLNAPTNVVVISCPGIVAGPGLAVTAVSVMLGGDGQAALVPPASLTLSYTVDPALGGLLQTYNLFAGSIGNSSTSTPNSPSTISLPLAGPSSAFNGFDITVTKSNSQGQFLNTSAIAIVNYTLDGIATSQSNPLLPDAGIPNGNGFTFTNVGSGNWFDPPFTNSFDYAGLGGTTFTSITLPLGFGDLAVSVGPGFGTSLGTFAPGSSISFNSLAGGAQSAFRISAITPSVDAANPAAFPLQIFFSAASGSFTQTASPVPEPSTIVSAGLALAGLFIRRRRP